MFEHEIERKLMLNKMKTDVVVFYCLKTKNASAPIDGKWSRIALNMNQSTIFMSRLHMQVWQPDTERKTCINVFSCCQGHAINSLWIG